ncbi:MAG: adenylate/guanylate cyclase domain-containing protein [Chloroflexota bacterium]
MYTFLFTDLEGSTQLWQQQPEAMKIALARHDALLRSAVESCNGQVVKTTGDGLHAVFASSLDSLNACLKAQFSLQDEPWGETGPLKVRMGLHAGEAQLRGGDYYGTAVNRAARLMAAAHGGQVLLSAAVAGIVADQLPAEATLRDLGEHRLKDLERAEHVFLLLHPGLPTDFPPIKSLNRRPNNLPTQTTALVGRKAELAEIEDRLNDDVVRLVTLTGPGGTGKTRLALQSAADLIDRFPDGAYFVDLAPIREPEAIFTAIARTIGLGETGDGPLIAELEKQLRGQKKLLILDNFEQVMEAAVPIAELLQHCPELKLLVTSREPLRVRGEHLYPVPPLAIPRVDRPQSIEQLAKYAAVQLFVDRARAAKPDFELTVENAEAISKICIRLDGLPLAIELAAARLRLFSAQALHERLGNRLKLLRGGARDLPARQQTLRDTIAWSYELLDADEQRLFDLLSIFAGCTFEAAEAVAGDLEALVGMDLDVFEGLASLVDKSLIRQVVEVAGAPVGEPRLQMLGTIRDYAAERLERQPELSAAARRAHAIYFADFAQGHWPRLIDRERGTALGEMAADSENLEIAWRYWAEKGDLAQLNKMVDSLWQLYDARGWYLATVTLTRDLLDVLGTTPSTPERVQEEIMLQTSLARALLAVKGYTPEVEQAYTRALALCDGSGDIPQLFPVLRGLGSYYTYRAQFDKSAEMAKRVLQLAESQDDDDMRIHGYLVLGASIGFFNGPEQGLEYLNKGIALYDPGRVSSVRFGLSNHPVVACHTSAAFFLWMLGYPDRAVKEAEESMALARRLNHPFTLAYATFHTGVLYMWRREMAVTEARALAMMEIAKEHDFQVWQAIATILHGAAMTGTGRPEEGLAEIERGTALYQDHVTPPVFWPMLVGMRARALAVTGKPAAALNLLKEELAGQDRVDPTAPEAGLLVGDLLLAISPDNAAGAKGMYQQALGMASEAKMKMLELQARTRLCRLARLEGDVEEAARQLRGCYDWFTEGLETADLLEARALLDELEGGA